MEKLTKEQCAESFDHIRNILLGKTFGSSKETNLDAYASDTFIDYVEFKNIHFIGDGSDDVDAFLNIIMNSEHSCPPIKKIIIFKFPQFHMETSLGNNIYVLAQDDAGLCYMVGGMTDYSGSGGAAYRKFRLIFQFLSELYVIQLWVRHMERGTESDLLDLVVATSLMNKGMICQEA